MNEKPLDPALCAFEHRSRGLFQASVADLDMRVQSRLTRARHAALDAVSSRRSAWVSRIPAWTPAVGMAVVAVLGVALWVGTPGMHNSGSSVATNLEDLDMVASSDGGSADPMEMLQDDIDFYDFADKAAAPEPAA